MTVDSQPNDLFLGLVASLQASAWMQLGKIVNPFSGKIDRDLERAHETIDLLGVLEEKTRGNLHPEEGRLLGQILYELRLNYVDELKRQAAPAAAAAPEAPTEPKSDPTASGPAEGAPPAPE